jgi:hypothetical protein
MNAAAQSQPSSQPELQSANTTAVARPIACACKAHTRASWVFQILAAIVLGQTLFFKFSGAEEARFIFTTLGVEPWGRLAAGVFELIAVVLLLVPRTAVFGAALSVGLMVGALGAHFGQLGISVKGDGGLLFGLAWVVTLSSAAILWFRKPEVLWYAGRGLKLIGR